MAITLFPTSRLQAEITLPASKSISNRALIIHALANGGKITKDSFGTVLKNISDCDDTFVMVRALTQMPDTIDIKAAGTAMRFLTAYLSVTPGTHIITGTERMRHRPIGILVDALRQLGAQVEYAGKEGFPPLCITGGNHKGGRLELPGNVSSQYISALLMIGPVLEEGISLTLTGDIVSRPYIEMTLSIMRDFGAQAEWISSEELKVMPGGYQTTPYLIENDWSASSYWYEMIALAEDNTPTIVLPGLFSRSLQGDSAIADIFRPLGIVTSFVKDTEGLECVRLTRVGEACQRMDYDFVNQPDLAQTLVVTCAMLSIPFRFTGLQSLKIKETDRMAALQTELRKLGYVIKEQDDSILYWEGERCPAQDNPIIDTYEDHRMAMALAPCAMKRGSLRINNPEVVSKSYPTFWEDLGKAGFKICR
ncbi:MAG: 3-phosphoshikimate 1-carboxyvinyltransferase [Bacteroidaceae bacterium]|nr:3-phosphoshikimate 1-carboxyvinyltransferase [Bacteroidaceae bacterium]